ncbi:MAG: hypothetical protein QXE66_01355 [Desulfurococcaceae archaeon]
MSYKTKKMGSRGEKVGYLDELVEKLEDLKLRLTPLEPLVLNYEIGNKGSREELVFDPPVRSKLLVYTGPYEKIVIYDRRSLEVVGMRTITTSLMYWEPTLVVKTDDQTHFEVMLSFSELLGFLFYSGGYERIRRGEYRGFDELAEVVLDVGELVYNNPKAPQLDAHLPQKSEDSHYAMTYFVNWESKPWLETRYVGIKTEYGEVCSLVILDGKMQKIADAQLVRSGGFARGLLWLKIDTFNKLPVVRRMVESVDEMKNEFEKYITNLRLAYIGTKTFTSLGG